MSSGLLQVFVKLGNLHENFELRPLLNPQGSPVLIPLAITGYKCSSKFHRGSRVWQTPEEGRKAYWPKHCGNTNKDEDNSPKTLNDKNHEASSQKFRQLKFYTLTQRTKPTNSSVQNAKNIGITTYTINSFWWNPYPENEDNFQKVQKGTRHYIPIMHWSYKTYTLHYTQTRRTTTVKHFSLRMWWFNSHWTIFFSMQVRRNSLKMSTWMTFCSSCET